MKRQKRDMTERAFTKGYRTGNAAGVMKSVLTMRQTSNDKHG